MPKPVIDHEECTACGSCVEACPNGVLEIEGSHVEVVSPEDCTICETCVEECPMGIISDIVDED